MGGIVQANNFSFEPTNNNQIAYTGSNSVTVSTNTWIVSANATTFSGNVSVTGSSLSLGNSTVNTVVNSSYLTTGGVKLTKGSVEADFAALTDAANVSSNMANGINFSLLIGGNRNLDNPTNAVPGQSGTYAITQDATGSRTLTYSSSWKFAGGSAPTLTTTASATDLLFYLVVNSTFIFATTQLDVR